MNDNLKSLVLAFSEGVSETDIVAEVITKHVDETSVNVHLVHQLLCCEKIAQKFKEKLSLSDLFESLDDDSYRIETEDTIITVTASSKGVKVDAWNPLYTDIHSVATAKKMGISVANDLKSVVRRVKN